MATTETALTRTGNDVLRQEFGAIEATNVRETAAMATAAREKAVIEARFIYAMRNPRNMDDFEQELLKECRRPSFAEKVKYSLPKGKDESGKQLFIEGPTIRLVETALRCFRNTVAETATVYESEDLRICRITVSDLESNNTFTTEVQIEKTVERKGFFDKKKNQWDPPRGRIAISARPNSYGDMVFRCRATEDEILMKQNALVSKAVRTNALRFLPGDIIEAALETAEKTVNTKDAEDPDAAKRRILSSFAGLEIMPSDLQQYLGHSTDRISPEEIKQLRKIFSAIRDGETSWEKVLETVNAGGTAEDADKIAQEKIASEKARSAGNGGQTEAPAAEKGSAANGLFGGPR